MRIPGSRYDHREGNDYYTKAGNLYRLMPKDERQQLHRAIVGAKAYAARVKKALGWK